MFLIIRRDALFSADGFTRGWTSKIPGINIYNTIEEAREALKKKQDRLEDELKIVKATLVIEDVD